ncbi:hypothetical protein BpHYR1_048101 [Brachionus plicatilis]|uniref:Uncharacterized protein n=1 Tax=Brachionus plicatilis TaxID=10195 RepID=A0A3M7R6S8_BRAPC|nr:hypothetical protein BpHYR1_048101 [Brachionus plicatilis]
MFDVNFLTELINSNNIDEIVEFLKDNDLIQNKAPLCKKFTKEMKRDIKTTFCDNVILKIADIENSISMILRKFKYSVVPKYHSRQKPSVTPLQAMALTRNNFVVIYFLIFRHSHFCWFCEVQYKRKKSFKINSVNAEWCNIQSCINCKVKYLLQELLEKSYFFKVIISHFCTIRKNFYVFTFCTVKFHIAVKFRNLANSGPFIQKYPTSSYQKLTTDINSKTQEVRISNYLLCFEAVLPLYETLVSFQGLPERLRSETEPVSSYRFLVEEPHFGDTPDNLAFSYCFLSQIFSRTTIYHFCGLDTFFSPIFCQIKDFLRPSEELEREVFLLKNICVSTQIYIKIQSAFFSKGKGRIDERKSRRKEMYKLVLNCTVENCNYQINTTLKKQNKIMYMNLNKQNQKSR